MRKNITRRLLSAAAAAALGCSLCTNAVQALAEELLPTAVSCDESELVEVIVRLNGDAVLASPEASGQGTDYIDTAAAQSAEDKLLAAHEKAEKHIRRLYPELEIKRRFTLTANGFSCTLPESIIAEIESDPLVESVSEVKTDIIAEPQLSAAKELGGVTDYCSGTGCTGEGEVIAILDTEFDVTHDMFAPMTGKEVKIGRENVAEISSKGGFSTKLDEDRVYISNKVPFAYDYSDNTPYSLAAPAHYHGTHVSGIAAGNRITTSDGKEISGVAPDAQLLMMKVYGNEYGNDDGIFVFSDDDIAAAIEDAVKLKADVINMSFGRVYEYYDCLLYADSIAAAANAGVMLCGSAGNCSNDRFGMGRMITPENPDTGNISEPSIFPDVFSVASADNAVTVNNTLMTYSSQLDTTPSFSYCECGPKYCGEVLAGKEYPLVFVSQAESEITRKNVSGKIVAFEGSSEDYELLDENCLQNDAAAIIIANNDYAGMSEGFLYTAAMPIAVITEADFLTLKEYGIEAVSFANAVVSDEYHSTVSGFSSYGVGTSLDLKPEIMGIGGSVLSADYNNKTGYMSGTSMASPYIAGCVALYDQLMKEQGVELAGLDRVQRIKNVLMNTAVPVSDDGIPIGPRRQGAGLVSLENTPNDKVIMTGSTGKAAIELRDGLAEDFSFELNITNISSEDVTFPSSCISITSDGTEYVEHADKTFISGQTLIPSKYDLDGDITVPAGETITKTVSVSLATLETQALGEVFSNGYFIEGYVSLYGADNCCDISVPLIGFHGDWSAVPTIDTDRYPLSARVSIGYNEMRTDISFAKAAKLIKEVVSKDLYLLNLNSENPEEFPQTVEYLFSSEQEKRFRGLFDGVTYFSPNGDVFADYMGCYYAPTREASFTGIDLYDSNGKLLYATERDNHNSFEMQLALLPYEAYSLPDGRYSGRIDSHIRYGSMTEQSNPVDIAIDTKAPKVEHEVVDEDGRKILKLTATDSSLDGIYIMGTKMGNESVDSNASFKALALAQRMLSPQDYLETSKRIFSNYPQHDVPTSLTDFQTILTGMVKPPNKNYKFCDIIPAEPDENGSFSVSYDVTGLIEYSVSVVDRAFNESSFCSEQSIIPTFFAEGIWRGIYDDGDTYYEFHDDGRVRLTLGSEKYWQNGSYKVVDNKLYITTDGFNYDIAEIRWNGPYYADLIWENGSRTTLQHEFGSTTFEDFHFFSDEELFQLAFDYYNSLHGSSLEQAWTEVSSEDGTVSIYLYEYEESNRKIRDVYTVDRKTAVGVDLIGDTIDLKKAAKIKLGVWSGNTPTLDYGRPRYFNFTEFDGQKGKGVYAYQSDGIEHEFEWTLDGDTVSFSFDSYEDMSSPSRSAVFGCLNSDKLELTWDNGFYEVLKYNQLSSEISDIGFLTNDELTELTRAHFTKATGYAPKKLNVVYNGTEDLADVWIIYNDDIEAGCWDDCYTVNIITGKGNNSNGQIIDLFSDFAGVNTLGDVNGDDKIDAKDSSEILVYYSKMSTGVEGGFTDGQKAAANVNGDSMIDAKDASAILAYYSYISTGGTETLTQYLSPKG